MPSSGAPPSDLREADTMRRAAGGVASGAGGSGERCAGAARRCLFPPLLLAPVLLLLAFSWLTRRAAAPRLAAPALSSLVPGASASATAPLSSVRAPWEPLISWLRGGADWAARLRRQRLRPARDLAASGGVASAAPNASAAAGDGDDEPVIELFYSVCGGPAGRPESEYDYFGLLSLKSLLMARAQAANNDLPGWPRPRRRFRVHVLTDVTEPRDAAVGANSVANGGSDASSGVVDVKRLLAFTEVNREVELALRHEPDVEVRFHDIQALEAAALRFGARQAGLVPQTFFKVCAASRLKLPFLLREWGVRRALYLDYDTVLQCDLSQLWAHFARFEAGRQHFGFAPIDPRPLRRSPASSNGKDTYRLWNISRHPTAGGLNSGVMLLDVEGLALDDYWAEVLAEIGGHVDLVKEGAKSFEDRYWTYTKAFPLGDQDVVNGLFERRPHWLYVLPPEFNSCYEGDEEPGKVACVLHFCGGRLSPERTGAPKLPCDERFKAAADHARGWKLGWTS